MKHNVLFYNGRNKVGNLVGYVVKGKQLFRAYQSNVANPRTSAQTLQRAKFSLVSQTGLVFRSIVKYGLKGYARSRQSTELNAFFHLNYPKVTGTTPSNIQLDPEHLILAKGTRYAAEMSDTIDASSEPNTVEMVVISAASPMPDEAEDTLYGVLYNAELGEALLSAPGTRSDVKITFTTPRKWLGNEVYGYVFCVSPDGASQSNSVYVGHATIA